MHTQLSNITGIKVYNTPEMQRRTRAPNAEGDVRRGRPDAPGGGAQGQCHESFLSSIFSHLAEARAELEALAASKKSAKSDVTGGGGEREEQAVRVCLERCIGLVKGVVRGAPGLMTPAHSNRDMGLPLEVMISVKQTGARHASTGGGVSVSAVSSVPSTGSAVPSSSLASSTGVVASTSLPPPPPPLAPPENYALEVHPLETLGSLRERVAATNGFGSLSEFTRLSCHKSLSGDTQTMLEVGVTDGTGIWTILSAASVQGVVRASQAERHRMDDAERRDVEEKGLVHDGDVIAGQSGHFDELFRLLECAHGLKVCMCVLCAAVCMNLTV